MKAAPEIKGWCPGALTPMKSGDGLVVRVRPFNGHLTSFQAKGLAQLALRHGNGLLDLSGRANIQLRGVTQQSYPLLIDGLQGLALLDDDAETESRRNLIVSPFWTKGDQTQTLASDLSDALRAADAPDIPKKFGFAVDTGIVPVLQLAPADIRLECTSAGELLLVADGADTGKRVTQETAVSEAIALTYWFLTNCQGENRMAKYLAKGAPLPIDHTTPRQSQQILPAPGATPHGVLIGFAFGQILAQTLSELAENGGLRLTPWRMVLLETNDDLSDFDDLITDAADPLLKVTACTGAPGCTQALIETRPLARTLVDYVPLGQSLHVSGCSKGCAHPKPAALTITGAPDGLSIIRNGRASDTPTETGLTADQLIKAI